MPTFPHFQALLIEWTEDKATILAHTSEVWACYCANFSVQATANTILAIKNRK